MNLGVLLSSSFSMEERKQLVENPDEKLTYGWGSWRPSWLQCLNRPAWFLLFVSLGSFVMMADKTGFLGGTISTIEKRFHLQSKQSALIDAACYLCGLPVIILVGYYGPGQNRPLWIALGTLIFTCGSLMFALPHFLAYPYTYSNNSERDICKNDYSNNSEAIASWSMLQDGNHDNHLSAYLWVFIVASLLHSVGTAPLFTLGMPYIDDVTSREISSLYIGK